jgi:predicted small lipoprotein YifL
MAFAVMLIAACGKKGPLYLPDKAEAPPDAVAQGVHSSPPPRG